MAIRCNDCGFVLASAMGAVSCPRCKGQNLAQTNNPFPVTPPTPAPAAPYKIPTPVNYPVPPPEHFPLPPGVVAAKPPTV